MSRLWFFRPLLRSMHNSNDIDLVFEQVIDDPIRPLEYFTDVDIVSLWYYPTGPRECGNLLRPLRKPVNRLGCILRRRASDKRMDVAELILRRSRPVHLHSGNPN